MGSYPDTDIDPRFLCILSFDFEFLVLLNVSLKAVNIMRN